MADEHTVHVHVPHDLYRTLLVGARTRGEEERATDAHAAEYCTATRCGKLTAGGDHALEYFGEPNFESGSAVVHAVRTPLAFRPAALSKAAAQPGPIDRLLRRVDRSTELREPMLFSCDELRDRSF